MAGRDNVPPAQAEWASLAEQLRTLLKQAGLSQLQAASELGLDVHDLRDWCEARRKAPPVVSFALQYLAAGRTDTDGAAIAAACRAAALQAAHNAARLQDFTARNGLREQVETYTRLARRFEAPRRGSFARRPEAGVETHPTTPQESPPDRSPAA